MAYEKQTWVDGETIINAERMNHIEDGIKLNENNVAFFTVVVGGNYRNDFLDDLIEKIDLGAKPIGMFLPQNGSSVLTYSAGYAINIAGTQDRTLKFRFYVYFDSAGTKVFKSIDLSITRLRSASKYDNSVWTKTDEITIATIVK